MQEKLPMPLGTTDFKRICRENYYVDKTLLIKDLLGRLQVQIEQDLSSNYISRIHLIKKSVEQFIRSVVA